MALLVGDEMLKRRLSNTNMTTEEINILNLNLCRKIILRINTHRQTTQLLLNLHSI